MMMLAGQKGGAGTVPWAAVTRLLIAAALCLLMACAPAPQPSLRMATNQWLGYEPFYLARELDYLAAVPVQYIELPNASAVINAFRNGAIDIAALTLDEALLLQHDGMDLRILLVLDISHGADVLMAKPEIADLQALKNRRIGLESGAVGAYMLSRALTIAGLQASDVVIVPLTIDRHVDAYLAGEIDALVTFEPVRTAIARAGGHVVFDSRSLPNEIFDVLVVDAKLYRSRPDDLRQLMQAWFKALHYIAQSPHEAARLIAPRLDLDAKDIITGMNGLHWGDLALNRRFLSGTSPALLPAAQNMAAIMRQNRLLSREVDVSRLVDAGHKELLE